ncbi:MAG: hypothetical protein J5826_07145 [Bacteroidales bacterium]|nr:hypothetical protein [Bacteroidales bacterium]
MKGIQSLLIDKVVEKTTILEDPTSLLLNSAWRVLSDSGESEVLVFRRDRTLLLSNKGIVCQCSWDYLTINKTIVLNLPTTSYMLSPIMEWDNSIFFRIYSTSQYIIMMNEQTYMAEYVNNSFSIQSFVQSIYDRQQKQFEEEQIREQKKRQNEMRWKQFYAEVQKEMQKHRFLNWCYHIEVKAVFKHNFTFGMYIYIILMIFGCIISILAAFDVSGVSNIRTLFANSTPHIEIEFGEGFWWGFLETIVLFLIEGAAPLFITGLIFGLILSIVPFILYKIGEHKYDKIWDKIRMSFPDLYY